MVNNRTNYAPAVSHAKRLAPSAVASTYESVTPGIEERAGASSLEFENSNFQKILRSVAIPLAFITGGG
jgi:hypothetical protein